MNLKLYGYSKVLIKHLVFESVSHNISGTNTRVMNDLEQNKKKYGNKTLKEKKICWITQPTCLTTGTTWAIF